MRTTLSIDDDVLCAVKALAEQQRRSAGEVISDLARSALHRKRSVQPQDGIPQLPVSNPDAVVTLAIVNRLRDEEV